MAHPFFGELVSECLCVLNKYVNHLLEEDCHQCEIILAPRESWVKSRICLQRLFAMARVLRYPTIGSQVNVYCVPSKVKASCKLWLRGCSNGHWIERINQIYNSKIYTSCWLDELNNFNNIGYGDLNGWYHDAQVIVIHCEVPFILLGVRKDQIWLLVEEQWAIITLDLNRSYILEGEGPWSSFFIKPITNAKDLF